MMTIRATLAFPKRAQELMRVGKFFYKRGWVPATSGNFSARLDESYVAITASGHHKGQLNQDGIMIVDLDGRPCSPGQRPSAETLLHTTLYRRDPNIKAILHIHSVNATVLSLLHRDALQFTDYEVFKAFPGIDTHRCQLVVPIFPNDQDIARLTNAVEHYLDDHSQVYGYLIAGHGLYTWGASVEEACRHIEAFEFLFECELLMQRISKK